MSRPEIRLLAAYKNLYAGVLETCRRRVGIQRNPDLRQAWNDLKIDPVPTPVNFINKTHTPQDTPSLLVELDRLQEEVLALRKMNPAAQPAPPPIAGAASDSNRLIHFEKIPLRYERANGAEIKPEYYVADYQYALHVIRCTDSLDVYWCPRHVAFMRTPGVLVEAADLPADQKILDVKWDGAFLWIATAANELLKMDASGHVVTRLGAAQDLPPFDGGALLAVLGPDQLAMTGCFRRRILRVHRHCRRGKVLLQSECHPQGGSRRRTGKEVHCRRPRRSGFRSANIDSVPLKERRQIPDRLP